MKKFICVFLVIFCQCIAFAQIKQMQSTVTESKPVIQEYNHDKIPFDSLSNDLTIYSNIEGQQFLSQSYRRSPEDLYMIKNKHNEVKHKLKVMLIISGSLVRTTHEIDIISLTNMNTKRAPNTYLTILDVVVPKDSLYSVICSNPAQYDEKQYIHIDDIDNYKLVLNSDKTLSTYRIDILDKKPAKKEQDKYYFVNDKKQHCRYVLEPFIFDKPVITTPTSKTKPSYNSSAQAIAIMVEENGTDTLYKWLPGVTSGNFAVGVKLGGMSVGFYEKMVQLHKGVKFASPVSYKVLDKSSSVKGIYAQVEANKEYLCEDVVMKDHSLIAILTDGDNTFGITLGDKAYRLNVEFGYSPDSKEDLQINMMPIFDYPESYSAIPRGSYIGVNYRGDITDLTSKNLYPVDFLNAVKEHSNNLEILKAEHKAKNKAEKVAEYERRDAEYKAKQKARKDMLTAKYGEKMTEHILNGSVVLGMSKEMCIEAWGRPNRLQQTHLVEKLYYIGYDGSVRWLILTNNKVTEMYQ